MDRRIHPLFDPFTVLYIPELWDQGAHGLVVHPDRGGVYEEADWREGGFFWAVLGWGGGDFGAEGGEVGGQGVGDFPGGVDGVVAFEGLVWVVSGVLFCFVLFSDFFFCWLFGRR